MNGLKWRRFWYVRSKREELEMFGKLCRRLVPVENFSFSFFRCDSLGGFDFPSIGFKVFIQSTWVGCALAGCAQLT